MSRDSIPAERIIGWLQPLAEAGGEAAQAAQLIGVAIRSSSWPVDATKVVAGEILPSYRVRKSTLSESAIVSMGMDDFIAALELSDPRRELLILSMEIPSWKALILVDPQGDSALSCLLVKQ